MDINLFDYYLPEELIAQRPSEKRDHSRLLLVDRENRTYQDKHGCKTSPLFFFTAIEWFLNYFQRTSIKEYVKKQGLFVLSLADCL